MPASRARYRLSFSFVDRTPASGRAMTPATLGPPQVYGHRPSSPALCHRGRCCLKRTFPLLPPTEPRSRGASRAGSSMRTRSISWYHKCRRLYIVERWQRLYSVSIRCAGAEPQPVWAYAAFSPFAVTTEARHQKSWSTLVAPLVWLAEGRPKHHLKVVARPLSLRIRGHLAPQSP